MKSNLEGMTTLDCFSLFRERVVFIYRQAWCDLRTLSVQKSKSKSMHYLFFAYTLMSDCLYLLVTDVLLLLSFY